MTRKRKSALALGIAVLLTSLPGVAFASRANTPKEPSWALHGSYTPSIKASNFVRRIDNRFFPLLPGTAYHFRGYADQTPQTDDMVVTNQIKMVLGVRCTVVEDTVSSRGKPVERTFDWYAQDKQGNVWYMGEDSRELKNGKFVRASDSWQAGVKNAQPGIIMPGSPHTGQVYRQEYYPAGQALDQARILGKNGAVQVPAGTFRKALVTIEWSPVEPQLEEKLYVAGLGEVMEKVVAGGHEQFRLVNKTG